MTQIEERKLLRAMGKLEDNSGRIAKALERIADALEPVVLEAQMADSAEMPLPEIGKITTAEAALAAAKTIRDYCLHQAGPCDRCGVRFWCERERKYPPDAWELEGGNND